MTVDFIRHTWHDWPSTETPITADELNRLEEGIAGLYSDLDGIDLANIEQTVDDLEEAVENFKAGVEITQEEYDNLTPEEKNNGTVYYITDAPSTPAISALDASYNNSTSGLTATTVQAAIDEIDEILDETIEAVEKCLVYSTTEIACGKWIDGKTIYKKTFSGTSTSGVYSVDIESCNIDQPIKAELVMKNTNGGDFVLQNYYNGATDGQSSYLTGNKNLYNFRSGSNYSYGSFYLTLYYTKAAT